MLTLFNSLTKKKEVFKPMRAKKVGMYACGLTVYNYAHIGNLRTYVFEDVLKRVLLYDKYKIRHVMNITDVGHLSSDADEGEDKMEREAKLEKKTAWEIADFYTKKFKQDLSELNVIEPDIWCKATEHIKEQIKLTQALIHKGLTYETKDGIYFDTTKIVDYGQLANLSKQERIAGARVQIGEKKNPHDFALWKFSNPKENRQMEWEAFKHMGFPGWHLECSAMAIKYLGKQFDIHCGGIDHLSIHHTNEIAQSEAFTNKKPWVKYWMHGEFLLIKNEKMAKSKGNFITLDTLKQKGYTALDYRYLLLQTHYRKQLKFSWTALNAAKNGLEHLKNLAQETMSAQKSSGAKKCENKFAKLINDDLNIPEALALIWDMLKSNLPDKEKKASLIKFDNILGLGLASLKPIKVPSKLQTLMKKREQARKKQDWKQSDIIRKKIAELGFQVEDGTDGQKIIKKK